MKLGIIESAWFGTKVDLVEGVKMAKKIGFDTYDIFRDPYETTVKEKVALRKALEETGLPPIAQTCPAPALIDINTPIRRYAINWVKQWLDVGYEFGCKKLLLVVGEYIWERQVIKPEIQWRWAVEGLRELGDHAKSLNMVIAMELEPFHNSLINSVELMVKFLKDVNHPNVKANADVSHLHLIRLPPDELKKLKDLVAHVHFSDNNGQVHGDLPPGKGNAPLKDYLRVLKEMNYNDAISIELEFCPVPDKVVDWVTEAYKVTAQMMDELKIRG
ncbi:MAG: sugar phosphate isomerase/epimerase family protein [Nitrososphaerales archaeon]